MEMTNHFTFNGQSTADYGLLVTGRTVFGSPNRKVEKYSVPGRNGDIIVELGGFDNYIVAYDVAVIDSFATNARSIVNWLLSSNGYMRLEDTYDTSCYRLGAMYTGIEYLTTALNREGQATIQFDCKPQRFLLTGESVTTLNSSGTITNPSVMASKPLLRVYGTGKVGINGNEITIKAVDSYVDIDCETLQAYKGSTNCNNDIEVDVFPTLITGSNTITLTDVTKVEITPRWWEL